MVDPSNNIKKACLPCAGGAVLDGDDANGATPGLLGRRRRRLARSNVSDGRLFHLHFHLGRALHRSGKFFVQTLRRRRGGFVVFQDRRGCGR